MLLWSIYKFETRESFKLTNIVITHRIFTHKKGRNNYKVTKVLHAIIIMHTWLPPEQVTNTIESQPTCGKFQLFVKFWHVLETTEVSFLMVEPVQSNQRLWHALTPTWTKSIFSSTNHIQPKVTIRIISSILEGVFYGSPPKPRPLHTFANFLKSNDETTLNNPNRMEIVGFDHT